LYKINLYSTEKAELESKNYTERDAIIRDRIRVILLFRSEG